MKRLAIAPVALLFLSIASGQGKEPKPKDNWQRMRECAEQADRVAKRAGWVEMKRVGDVTLLSWQNHYSPKYQRCYVLVSYMNNDREKTGKKELPLFFYELYDAFESNQLASCSNDPLASDLFCLKGEGTSLRQWNCAPCREFVEDRMSN